MNNLFPIVSLEGRGERQNLWGVGVGYVTKQTISIEAYTQSTIFGEQYT